MNIGFCLHLEIPKPCIKEYSQCFLVHSELGFPRETTGELNQRWNQKKSPIRKLKSDTSPQEE